jgi:hypothetical protein
VVTVKAGGLLVCHLAGHLSNSAKLLLSLKDGMEKSSVLGTPPVLPRLNPAFPTWASHGILTLCVAHYELFPVSVVFFIYKKTTSNF